MKINVNSKTWDPATRNVNLSLTLTNLSAEIPGACWYNIFVTEDNLVHRHRVWTGCATPDQPVPPFKENFINDHVIRKLEYFAKGDSLIGPTWQAQQTINRSFSVHIDTGWVEGNCSLVFSVYKKNDSLYKAAIQQAIKQSVTGGVGMEEKKIYDDGIKLVYPNPTTDWVNIHLAVSRSGNCTLRIIDNTGKTIDTLLDQWIESGAYNFEYNTRDLPAGNYFLFLKSPSGESIKGIVVRL